VVLLETHARTQEQTRNQLHVWQQTNTRPQQQGFSGYQEMGAIAPVPVNARKTHQRGVVNSDHKNFKLPPKPFYSLPIAKYCPICLQIASKVKVTLRKSYLLL
jgi:hypothetical protein